jgi:hypothetical protein
MFCGFAGNWAARNFAGLKKEPTFVTKKKYNQKTTEL